MAAGRKMGCSCVSVSGTTGVSGSTGVNRNTGAKGLAECLLPGAPPRWARAAPVEVGEILKQLPAPGVSPLPRELQGGQSAVFVMLRKKIT